MAMTKTMRMVAYSRSRPGSKVSIKSETPRDRATLSRTARAKRKNAPKKKIRLTMLLNLSKFMEFSFGARPDEMASRSSETLDCRGFQSIYDRKQLWMSRMMQWPHLPDFSAEVDEIGL
jgi:hypothetical protein